MGADDVLVLIYSCWPSSLQLRVLSGGCFLPSAFEVLLLVSGSPAQLSPREGLSSISSPCCAHFSPSVPWSGNSLGKAEYSSSLF